MKPTEERIKSLMEEEETKAWNALGSYKFYMFGYHARCWVKLNKLLTKGLPNPFTELVRIANKD